MKFDIVSIGDASENIYLELEEANVHCGKGTNKCTICMSFSNKIPVASVYRLVGGNAANMAVGSARLKLKTAQYLELGDDEAGKKIYKTLKDEGVSLKYVSRKKHFETNFSAVLDYHAERTILVYHVKRSYKLPALDKSGWVYYTSLGLGFEKMHPDLVKYIKRSGAKLGFNPGTHQIRSGVKKFGEILKITDVIILNKEEAQLFTNTSSGNFNALLQSLLKLGPKAAVVTDGPNGSYAGNGKEFYYQNIYDTPVVERTGCGDSYSTGFLAALSYGYDFREAMRWGTMNAAFVVQKVGSQPGLLHLKDMKRLLGGNPKFQPKKMSELKGNYTKGFKPLLLLKNF